MPIPELSENEFAYGVAAGNGYIVTTNVEMYSLENETADGVSHSIHHQVRQRQDYYDRPPPGYKLVFGYGILVSSSLFVCLFSDAYFFHRQSRGRNLWSALP